MVNKLVIIAIAAVIIIGSIGIILYSENTYSDISKETSQTPKQEPKKFTVDLAENVGVNEP